MILQNHGHTGIVETQNEMLSNQGKITDKANRK